MEALSKIGTDELVTWLQEKGLSNEVIKSFTGLCD